MTQYYINIISFCILALSCASIGFVLSAEAILFHNHTMLASSIRNEALIAEIEPPASHLFVKGCDFERPLATTTHVLRREEGEQ